VSWYTSSSRSVHSTSQTRHMVLPRVAVGMALRSAPVGIAEQEGVFFTQHHDQLEPGYDVPEIDST
jgi:hypothetical protein